MAMREVARPLDALPADILRLGPEPSIRILDARVLRGPSRWSRKPMIRMLVDLGVLERFPSDRIHGFAERLLAALPGLYTHTCSVGIPGGFVRRLHEGTWLGHVAEHVAIELQDRAGSAVTRGKTRGAGREGLYDIVFAYAVESIGLEAGRSAVDLVNALVDPGRADPSHADADEIVARLRALADRDGLGPSTQAIVDEAHRRSIPVIRLDERNLVQLGWGTNAHRVRATITDGTGTIATDLASGKDDAALLLERAGLPVPDWRVATTANEAARAASAIGVPVVVKPVDGNHGRAISLDLRTDDAVAEAFEKARAASRRGQAIVQAQLHGTDHRLLVVGGALVACAERVPAGVSGDGTSRVRELVERVNRDPRRGDGHGRPLTRIALDAAALELLADQGLAPDSVPERGRWIPLARTANLSTGGTSVDRTLQVHPEVARVASMAARLIGLDIAGVDVVTPDISRPLREAGGGIVEVNAAPGFRMHTHPTVGRPRNVARAVVDHLFPGGSEGRIPIAAVTGTNGKTTTTRMLAHLAGADGRLVGATTTDGIVVDGWTMKHGDMAGPGSARTLLGVPTIETAILEVARGGLLREGLGYDWNDVAVVTNVAADHLGLDGIATVEQMATVKGVIVEAVPRTGTAVLNADDRLVLRMAGKCRGAVALTSTARDPGARGRLAVERHLAVDDGGPGRLGGLVEGGEGAERIVICRGEDRLVDVPVREIPATFDGAAWMNVSNALQAACAALALGIAPALVERGLRTFRTSVETAPGRLNRTWIGGVEVVIDYAHNLEGLRAFAAFLERIRDGRRTIGVASIPGDRRPEDQRAFGSLLGTLVDELIVAEPNPRGRSAGETAALLIDAARSGSGHGSAHPRAKGGAVPQPRVRHAAFIADEADAARAALDLARPGDLLVLCVAHAKRVYESLTAPLAAARETRAARGDAHRSRPAERERPARPPARSAADPEASTRSRAPGGRAGRDGGDAKRRRERSGVSLSTDPAASRGRSGRSRPPAGTS